MGWNEEIQRDLDEYNRLIAEASGQRGRKKRIPMPDSIKNEILVRQQYRCHNCKNILPASKHFHHIEHISKGGNNALDNLIALCPNCHSEHHHQENLSDGRGEKKITKKNQNTIHKKILTML